MVFGRPGSRGPRRGRNGARNANISLGFTRGNRGARSGGILKGRWETQSESQKNTKSRYKPREIAKTRKKQQKKCKKSPKDVKSSKKRERTRKKPGFWKTRKAGGHGGPREITDSMVFTSFCSVPPRFGRAKGKRGIKKRTQKAPRR